MKRGDRVRLGAHTHSRGAAMSGPDFAAVIGGAEWRTLGQMPTEVLAAKVPELCQTCGGSRVNPDIGPKAHYLCPDCPTIAKLLAIGAAVMVDDYRTASDTEHRAFAKYRDHLRAVQP